MTIATLVKSTPQYSRMDLRRKEAGAGFTAPTITETPRPSISRRAGRPNRGATGAGYARRMYAFTASGAKIAITTMEPTSDQARLEL
ncbi:hypothetical protein NSER024013_06610 [Nocardia seriolae]|nr:hypothetical protein NSER024013_06610 [Nocardia seriolae]